MLAPLGSIIFHGIKAIWLYKNWYVPFCVILRFPDSQVTCVLRNGAKFKVKAGDLVPLGIINKIWLDKIYTPVGDEIRKDSTIVDIGAHIGSFSVFAATRAENVKVFSYEPSSENFSLLTENIKLNDLKNIEAFQLAVSGVGETVKLYLDKKHSVLHSTAIPKGVLQEEVKSVTLKEIFDSNQIDKCNLLKMDCEGAEYEILFGAPKSTLARIQNISMEYHDVLHYHIGGLRKYLQDMGFDVWLDRKTMLYARK